MANANEDSQHTQQNVEPRETNAQAYHTKEDIMSKHFTPKAGIVEKSGSRVRNLSEIECLNTMAEILEAYSFEEIKKAILNQEKQRGYHKDAYIKRADKLELANRIIAEAEKRGITLN
jgi:hypothetical protein